VTTSDAAADRDATPRKAAPGPARPLRHTTADGITLRGTVRGQGAPAILFGPGAGLPVQVYAHTLAPLAATHTVLALNPRGHGDSDGGSAGDGWAPCLADWRDFVAAQPAPLILAGHSFGAMLALATAAAVPDKVTGLLLLDPLARGTREQPWPAASQAAAIRLAEATSLRTAHWATREAAAAWLRETSPYRHWAPAAREAFLEAGLVSAHQGGLRPACDPAFERSLYEGRRAQDIFAWADAVRAPTVILRGKDSPVASDEGCASLAERLPIATVLTVGGGHMFPLDAPPACAGALMQAVSMLARTRDGVAAGL